MCCAHVQVKDRFCSLLSDQVASLQDQLKQMRLDKTPEPEEPSSSAEDPSHPNHAQEVYTLELQIHGLVPKKNWPYMYMYSTLLYM